MTPTFEKTVDILVKAYLNDTLEHANCAACAIGNLIAHAKGVKPVLAKDTPDRGLWRFSDGTLPEWQHVFCSEGVFGQIKKPHAYIDTAKQQIDSTGYAWQDLARIEAAFEAHGDRLDMRNQSPAYRDELMFNGLMAVVEVLADIHGVSLEQKEEAKLLFVKA